MRLYGSSGQRSAPFQLSSSNEWLDAWTCPSIGGFTEAGFAVLSVEHFSAAGAAAALLFVACVVCVATAAFQACAFPRMSFAT